MSKKIINMTDPHLVTTRSFNGREYFVKMNVANSTLELVITDKQTGEEWQCSYEATYIENITQKTGNFKQFDIFITMLKSGLLKTSNCVYLDLMTFEDLDSLRNHRARGPYSHHHVAMQANSNRRYLILTYTVEFDRIHYPLPLEYTGHPDPAILQTQIKRLEDEVQRLKSELSTRGGTKHDAKILTALNDRVEELTVENEELQNEIKRLSALSFSSKSKNQIQTLQKAIRKLENSVMVERQSHNRLVEKLRHEKELLSREVERLKNSEKQLMIKLKNTYSGSRTGVDMKRLSDPCRKGPLRSTSPRVCRSESWEMNLRPKVYRAERRLSRRKSRSSSESSGRHTDLPKYKSDDFNRSSRSHSRKFDPSSRSQSGQSSRCSSVSRDQSNVNVTSRDVIKLLSPKLNISKNPSIDFANLETRISALQKALFSDKYAEN